jgi:SAM-dependent methyltransferase
LWVALTFGVLLNGARLRQRLARLQPLDQKGGAVGDDGFVLVHHRGVGLDGATRRVAVAHAESEGLDVLDLVPVGLPLSQTLDLARGVDAATYRSAPLAAGRGALHVLLVRRSVWERLEPPGPGAGGVATPAAVALEDRAAMVRITERLKLYAARATDLAATPGLQVFSPSAHERLGEVKALYGGAAPVALGIPAARSCLLAAGFLLSPGWGVAAGAGFLVQPYLVTAGNPVAATDRSVARSLLADARARFKEPFTLMRAAWAAVKSAKSARAAGAAGSAGAAGAAKSRRTAGTRQLPAGGHGSEDPIEARRPGYTASLAEGTQRFFEPRRDTCPWCGGTALAPRIRTPDLTQFKPGRFEIDECAACGLLFQNPRLSIEGLDFYYRDFYDGLGAGEAQFLFAQSQPSYRGRVALAQRHAAPKAWLDVGSGYGHFCVVARGMLPETRFDGLDMGSSIEEAERRGWIDHAHRGLFPDLAGELKGRYDLVSMHHYLEHTRDPRDELDAAHAVLEPGGHLLIEVPDPECRFARVFGRYWLPWLQPQHQQFLSVTNLSSALECQGFEVIEVERGQARQPIDLGGFPWLLAARWAPPPRLPWRRDPTPLERLRRWAVFGVLTPLAAVGMIADRVIDPLIKTRAQAWSNTYRVLAQRR